MDFIPDDEPATLTGRPEPDLTRLDVLELTRRALTEPTQAMPRVPRRTDPAPAVTPIPADRRRDATVRPTVAPATAGDAGDVIRQVLDRQHELNMAAQARIVRRGPGGLFGWRPAAKPSLAEVAAARRQVAVAEERRRHAHQRHLDHLEAARGWAALLCLLGLLVIIIGAGFIAFGILAGWYAWAPTRVTP